jgi:hypothetical protein
VTGHSVMTGPTLRGAGALGLHEGSRMGTEAGSGTGTLHIGGELVPALFI